MFTTGQILEGKKKVGVLAITGLIIYLAGTLFAINWIEFLDKRSILWSPICKISVSAIAMTLVFITGKNAIDNFDRIMLPLVFVAGFIGDIFVVLSTDVTDSAIIFQIGGLSFIVSQSLLVLRNSKMFVIFRKDFTPKKLIFPLCFIIPMACVYIILFPLLQKAGLVLVASVYVIVLALALWSSWETVHSHLLPRKNAFMVGIGSTSFITMEIVGMVYNARIPFWGDFCKVFTWFFYIIALILFAFSGYTLFKNDDTAKAA